MKSELDDLLISVEFIPDNVTVTIDPICIIIIQQRLAQDGIYISFKDVLIAFKNILELYAVECNKQNILHYFDLDIEAECLYRTLDYLKSLNK